MIVEDDEISSRIINHFIENTSELELTHICKDAFEALDILKNKENDIHIIFLDVELPQMSGIEFLEVIKDSDISVVLTTSRPDYASEAFEYDVTDYLVKPIKYPRFLKAIERVKEELDMAKQNDNDLQYLFVKVESKIIRIEYKDIDFIEALADYVIINTVQKKHIVHATMKGIDKKLTPSNQFFRVHRSFIVNKERIASIEDVSVLIGSKSIPIGRSYRSAFFKKLDVL